MSTKNKKTIVMLPTYNEAENIKSIIESLLSIKVPNLDIVVADDNSPDGTWKIVEEISKKNRNVHLLLRKEQRGRGYGGAAGMQRALDLGADYIIEMDADFSHNPEYIPEMLKKLEEYDIVVGSRNVKGGKDTGRSKLRELISFGANLYIRTMLGVKLRDCNSGYKAYTREALEKINPKSLKASGPDIVQECLYKAKLNNLKILEIPIIFEERHAGKSKLGIKHLINGLLVIIKLRWRKLRGGI